MADSIASSPSGRADVVQRAAVTGLLVLLAEALAWIPLPFTAPAVAAGTLGQALSIRELGLSPVLSGFVLVELVALAIPRLQRLRNGSAAERAGLTRVAWGVAMVFAAAQAYGVVSYLSAARSSLGIAVLREGQLAFGVAALTLVAGTALLSAISLVISRRGLGNGLAVLVAGDVAREFLRAAARLAGDSTGLLAGDDGLLRSPLRALLVAVCIAGPLVLLARAARGAGDPATRVPAPTSGLVPVTWAASLWVLPAAAAPLLGYRDAWSLVGETWLAYGDLGRFALALILTIPLAHLFTQRRRVEATWRATGPAPAPETVRASLRSAHVRSLALVAAVEALPVVTGGLRASVLAGTMSALAVVVATAVDVVEEARARARLGPLVSAYPLQRVYAAPPALAALAAAGIPAATRALRYRVLEQFFAPFAPVEILVPEGRAEEAAAVCARVARAPDAAPPPPPSST